MKALPNLFYAALLIIICNSCHQRAHTNNQEQNADPRFLNGRIDKSCHDSLTFFSLEDLVVIKSPDLPILTVSLTNLVENQKELNDLTLFLRLEHLRDCIDKGGFVTLLLNDNTKVELPNYHDNNCMGKIDISTADFVNHFPEARAQNYLAKIKSCKVKSIRFDIKKGNICYWLTDVQSTNLLNAINHVCAAK